MVKVLYLGLFAAIVCAFALAGPIPPPPPPPPPTTSSSSLNNHNITSILADDGTVRSERSTNLSHITGSARKIQMYVKNWHLQILPDGVVNGSADDTSDYTILQRTTVNIGQLKIQGVATCQYLCMDSCGLLYASKDFVDECIFNEMIEQHHYNTYSSWRYSNARRTMYLALNRRGQPRKVQVRAQQPLGKLSTYARVLTKTVSVERVEDLLSRLGEQHPLRHHGGGHCTSATDRGSVPGDWPSVDRLRCRKRRKRKKKRRRCDGSGVCKKNNNKCRGENCKNSDNKKCDGDNSSKKCQRLAKSDSVTVKNKKRKQQQQKQFNARKKSRKINSKKTVKKVLQVTQPEESTTMTTDFLSGEENSSSMVYDNATATVNSESVEENLSVDEQTMSTIEDSEQIYDDATASSTQPSEEVD